MEVLLLSELTVRGIFGVDSLFVCDNTLKCLMILLHDIIKQAAVNPSEDVRINDTFQNIIFSAECRSHISTTVWVFTVTKLQETQFHFTYFFTCGHFKIKAR